MDFSVKRYAVERKKQRFGMGWKLRNVNYDTVEVKKRVPFIKIFKIPLLQGFGKPTIVVKKLATL